jgi:hypothetical protein
MEAIHLTTTIAADGTLHIDAPSHLPPGPAEVVVVVSPVSTRDQLVDWIDAYGLGKEIWEGVDAQAYVNELRDEWER